MSELKQMAKDVSTLQSEMENQDESTRDRVLRMGRALRKMQKLQKLEQKADIEAGNTYVTWNEWLEEKKAHDALFPGRQHCNRYALISKYPGAYKKGMSINEGYRQAGIWKSNGGNPPITEKKTTTNPLILVSHKASPFQRKVRVMCSENDQGSPDLDESLESTGVQRCLVVSTLSLSSLATSWGTTILALPAPKTPGSRR